MKSARVWCNNACARDLLFSVDFSSRVLNFMFIAQGSLV